MNFVKKTVQTMVGIGTGIASAAGSLHNTITSKSQEVYIVAGIGIVVAAVLVIGSLMED